MVLYDKGVARRKLLLDTALELLGRFSLETITLRQVAAAAKVPPSSVYHFFGNIEKLFIDLAKCFGDELVESVIVPYSSDETGSWQQLYSAAIDRGVGVYLRTPAYCQLILSPHSPPVIKLSDRKNDAELATLFAGVMGQHFKLPGLQDLIYKLYCSIEIVDLFLSLSFIHQQKIVPDMVEEAKFAAIAYLGRYLPDSLPQRS